MDREKVLGLLNEALAQEHACHIRYGTHAAVEHIIEDEQEHLEELDRLRE